MGEPLPLEGPLRKLASSLGLGSMQAGKVFTSWPEAVGEDVAARCRPNSLRDGVLEVTAESPGWAAELRYLGPAMAARVNEFLGAKVVARVEVRVGAVDGASRGKVTQTNDRLDTSGGLSREEVLEADALAEPVGDPRLAEALKRAHLAGKMRARRSPTGGILGGRKRRLPRPPKNPFPEPPKEE
jgi:hypothetical protein